MPGASFFSPLSAGMAVTLSEGSFFGIVFETFFYAAFLLVFAISVFLQWDTRQANSTFGNKLVFGFTIILFCFITTHWWLNLWMYCDMFVDSDIGRQPNVVFANAQDVRNITQFVLYEMQVWMGDVILIYRLYYVSNKKLTHIAFACLTSIATVVCSCTFLQAIADDNLSSAAKINNWTIGTFICTLTENVYCAFMIAFHIWKNQHDMRFTTRTNFSPILRIFIESALLWILLVAATFIAYLTGSHLFLILYYSANPVLGVSFCLMTVRTRLQQRGCVSSPQHIDRPKISPFPTVRSQTTRDSMTKETPLGSPISVLSPTGATIVSATSVTSHCVPGHHSNELKQEGSLNAV